MNNDVSRNDIIFLNITKEIRTLRQKVKAARQLLSSLEDGRFAFHNQPKKPSQPYVPLDFTEAHDPVVMAFAPAFEIITQNFDRLVRYINALEKRISDNEELIEAYHNGQDIVMAKLALVSGE